MQATKDLSIKARADAIGTRGFRAPEIAMNKDYNEKCDIFSIGIILFVMLTNKMPFSRIIDNENKKLINKANQYSLESSYQLFCESNNIFWMKLVGITPNTDEKVRNLIFRMLDPNPNDRIAANEITSHQWYNLGSPQAQTTTASSDCDDHDDAAFKISIDSLVNQRNGEKVNENINLQSKHSLPSWVDENELFEYTTDIKGLIESVTEYVATTLKGNVVYYQESQTLHCHVTDPSVLEFGVTFYESHKWNAVKSTIDVKNIPIIYTILMQLVQGTKEHFDFVKREMLSVENSIVSQAITGVPKDIQTAYHAHQLTLLDALSLHLLPVTTPASPSLNEVRIQVYNRRHTCSKPTVTFVHKNTDYNYVHMCIV